MLGEADFTTVMPGDSIEGTTTVDGGDTGGVPGPGGLPVTVAVFVTPPASTSSCVTTYGAVHVTVAPGASDAAPAGHVTTGGVPVPVNTASVTPTSVRVTLPVFVMRKEYVIVCPAAVISVRSAVLATVRDGAGGTVTIAVDGGDTGGSVSPGGVPVAVAVFVIWPASMSACVVVYVAVQVICAEGARDAAPAGQVMAGAVPVPVKAVSVTVTSVSVTLPVFVTKKEYVIGVPTVDTVAGSADFTTVMAGDSMAGTTTVDGGDTGGSPPPGGLPVPVAVFVSCPASMSAWVTTYGAVQVTVPPGASDAAPAGQVTTGGVPVPENDTSSTPTSVRVTFPVLVSRKEYVIV